MKNFISNLLTWLFARPALLPLNRLMFFQAARNLGFYNHMESLSGEAWFLKTHGQAIISVVDVGAHRGMYYKMCREALPALQTYRGFEPHPNSFAVLKEMNDGDCSFHNFAVSSEPGTVTLYDYANWDGSIHASVYQDVFGASFRSDDLVAHEIPAMSLDALLAEERIGAAQLLKIDVEGHELSVLKGAQRFLETVAPRFVMMEYNEHALISRYHIRDIMAALPGYQLYRLLPSGLAPIERAMSLENKFSAYCNLVAIRD